MGDASRKTSHQDAEERRLSKPATLGGLFQRAGLELPPEADPSTPISGLEDDSRRVGPKVAFLAVRGEEVDGNRFIQDAFDKGAPLVIAEAAPAGASPERFVLLPDTRAVRGRLAQASRGAPSRRMDVIGVTGTNGKTTTAYLTESILREAGRSPALFSTVEYRYGDDREPALTTTPGAFALADAMARAYEGGADSAVMEVSSHSLVQGRVDGLRFAVGLMTNLTQDHLDYHHSMEEYRRAKQLLFTRYKPGVAVFNFDDATARGFAEEHDGRKRTYSLESSESDVFAEEVRLRPDGVDMWIRARRLDGEEDSFEVRSPLRGRFNASNLLAAAAVGVALGLDAEAIALGLGEMKGAPGRFEAIDAGQPFPIYVDYAHTPDAVERLLESVRDITPGRLIGVLGCGGDRDPGKRPIMGAALGRLADYGIITNDNPRTEDPARIAEAMVEGMTEEVGVDNYSVILDREEAIRRAIEMAREGDSVVIAGKGHEDYQIVGREKRHFDDREVARKICRELYGRGET